MRAQLKISITGELYTEEEKERMWKAIHKEQRCPECRAKKTLFGGPSGGGVINLKCGKCKTIFWSGSGEVMAAFPIAGGGDFSPWTQA